MAAAIPRNIFSHIFRDYNSGINLKGPFEIINLKFNLLFPGANESILINALAIDLLSTKLIDGIWRPNPLCCF